LAALAAAAVSLVASTAAAVNWREVSRGTASGAAPKAPIGFVAYSRSESSRFWPLVPVAKGRVVDIDFRHNALVAVVGEFGCQDARIVVKLIAQRGSMLLVSLVKWPLAARKAECAALFPTYRLLTVAKAQLSRPYPSRVEVRLASA
jgi:hypothetical protein